MEIGIITLWKSRSNYGQVLQMWALQNVLKDNGHVPYIIKFHYDVFRKSFFKRLREVVLIYPIIIKILNYSATRERRKLNAKNIPLDDLRDFDSFKNSELSFSGRAYFSLSDLQDNPPQAECYVAGSDQVWGYTLGKKDNEAFFLNFGGKKIKKVSYAASFGKVIYPQELMYSLHENLSRFDAVSIRERSGVAICKEVGIDARWVLDPTLLLRDTNYRTLMLKSNPEKGRNPFVYIYYLNISSEEELPWQEIVSYAESHDLKITKTVSSGYLPAKELYDEGEFVYPSVYQWLSYIHNSDVVVTTSFHGVVFCILFHKQFAYIPIRSRFGAGNARVTELLERLNLSHHVYNGSSLAQIIESNDDWNLCDCLLEDFRKESINFLLNAINVKL